jgi:hypothetical protein
LELVLLERWHPSQTGLRELTGLLLADVEAAAEVPWSSRTGPSSVGWGLPGGVGRSIAGLWAMVMIHLAGKTTLHTPSGTPQPSTA